MSRVYFHSPSGEVELWGGERAWLGSLCGNIARGFFDVEHSHERIGALCTGELPYTEYLKYPGLYPLEKFWQWQKSAALALTGAVCDDFMSWKGHRISSFSLVLNTACLIGNDAVKLAARIHGQCEIHCYIEGADRAWVAGIIQDGLKSGVFRDLRKIFPEREFMCAWDDVITFLTSRADEPVVLSYSVCESFPDMHTIEYEAPEVLSGCEFRPTWCTPDLWAEYSESERVEHHRSECWDRLTSEEQWELGMTWLRAQDKGLRIQPADWNTFKFTHELSVLDITAPDFAERLDRTFNDVTEQPVGQ